MVAWAPPKKKQQHKGLNDCCWWKHHACALNPTVSKIPLPFFHFTIFHPPPPTPERHPEISSHAISVMPWRAEAIAMMIHLEAMGQPPLQWLQVDWWTPDWKKKCIWLPWNWNRNSKFHHLFFWGRGEGERLVSCFVVAKIHLEIWRFPKSTFTGKLQQKKIRWPWKNQTQYPTNTDNLFFLQF